MAGRQEVGCDATPRHRDSAANEGLGPEADVDVCLIPPRSTSTSTTIWSSPTTTSSTLPVAIERVLDDGGHRGPSAQPPAASRQPPVASHRRSFFFARLLYHGSCTILSTTFRPPTPDFPTNSKMNVRRPGAFQPYPHLRPRQLTPEPSRMST